MAKGIDWLIRGLEVLLVILLAGMAIMVFGNVVLRYGFNSGILVSEEMSRYFFVWLTFIGAVVTFRENAHLGVESLVQRFGRNGRLICMVLSDVIILLCMAAFFWGTWKQYPINASMTAPVVGMNDVTTIRLDRFGIEVHGPGGLEYEVGCFDGRGVIAGKPVRCLNAEILVRYHTGYELTEKDYHDVMALHRRFGVPLPYPYDPEGDRTNWMTRLDGIN
jgi:TRAP-type C4-dicarboxylate transport system permease small subunit